MNGNNLAKEITLIEGGKKNLSIAQVKEVLKIVSFLAYNDPEVLALLLKLGKKNSKV